MQQLKFEYLLNTFSKHIIKRLLKRDIKLPKVLCQFEWQKLFLNFLMKYKGHQQMSRFVVMEVLGKALLKKKVLQK